MPCKSPVVQYTYCMSKRLLLFIFGLFATIAIIIVLLLGISKKEEITSPIDENREKPVIETKKLSEKLKEFVDPSGFKFSYPESLNLEIVDKKDPAYYSSLKLKSPTQQGSVIIEVTSTKYKSLDDWVKNNNQIVDKSKDIKLADLMAKEIKYDGKLLIVAVDIETLITITSNFSKNDEAYWKTVTDTLVSTFTFAAPDTSDASTQSTGAGEEDVIFEGEETIE